MESGWVVYGPENGYNFPYTRLLRVKDFLVRLSQLYLATFKQCILRGCVTVLEIAFVGQCEVFVCLDFVHFSFFPLAAKLIGPQTGCQFFQKCRFFRHLDFVQFFPWLRSSQALERDVNFFKMPSFPIPSPLNF